MRDTRRKFIKTAGVGAALAAGAPGITLAKSTGLDRSFSAFSISAADLATYVGTSFKISCGGTSSRAVLRDVEEVKSKGARPHALPRCDAFVAVFDGVEPAVFDQQISAVEHAELGRLDLLLNAADGNRVSALFN